MAGVYFIDDRVDGVVHAATSKIKAENRQKFAPVPHIRGICIFTGENHAGPGESVYDGIE